MKNRIIAFLLLFCFIALSNSLVKFWELDDSFFQWKTVLVFILGGVGFRLYSFFYDYKDESKE